MDQTGTGATVVCHEGGAQTVLTGAELNARTLVSFRWVNAPVSTAAGVSITKDLGNAAGGFVLITDDALVDPSAAGDCAFEVYLEYLHSIVR
jgi:hypothetical protein